MTKIIRHCEAPFIAFVSSAPPLPLGERGWGEGMGRGNLDSPAAGMGLLRFARNDAAKFLLTAVLFCTGVLSGAEPPSAPRRILSLAPSVTEILFALKLG